MSSSRACLALLLCVGLTAVEGCSTPATSALPQPAAQTVTRAVSPDRGSSWMAPDAAATDLLYVSDVGSNDVLAYAYPGGASKGKLTGFSRPAGLCVDKVGDVFVTDLTASKIFEYAHGGTKLIATLKDPGEEPGDCSVDPVTGDLAVTNVSTPYTGAGDLVIYKGAKGTPKRYKDSAIVFYEWCGYDANGNLYLDGMNTGKFAFAELPAGQTSFTNITLNQHITYAGAVQWDGNAIAVGDYLRNAIYRFSISGSTGKKVGTTNLKGADYAIGFWIEGTTVIGPNDDAANVMFWKYPAGGSHTKKITGLRYPWGATVSLAPN